MAFSALIGALRVTLGLDSAEFSDGANSATRRAKAMEKDFARFSGRMTNIGKNLSLAITAPLAGIGLAMARASGQMANEAKQMSNAATLAGEGFEEFQRQSYAARGVGIEFEKLGDIFKDVRDKIGDFAATGGGEMADFFENIAPKVGLTADAFKGLSGKDALQLYYNSLEKAGVSQEEMVFYLEAIGDEASGLIPLLQSNGKAFDELGKKAKIIGKDDAKQLKEYNAAQLEMEGSMRKLTIAVVNSGLLEAITDLVEGVADFVGRLSETNPKIVKWTAIVGAIAATVGPVIGVFGGLIGVVGKMIPLLGSLAPAISIVSKALLFLAANPAILAFAAVVGGIYLAWRNWDKIEPIIVNLYNAVKTWVIDKLTAAWDFVKGAVTAYFDLYWSLTSKAIDAVASLYQGVKTWLQDKLTGVFDYVKGKVEAVGAIFEWLYDKVVGHSWIPDMVDGIAREMARLDAVMAAPAAKAAKKTSEAMRALASDVRAMMDRLFPEAARLKEYLEDIATIDKAVKLGAGKGGLTADQASLARYRAGVSLAGYDPFSGDGIKILLPRSGQEPLTKEAQEKLEEFTRSMARQSDKIRATNVRIAESFKDMAQKTLDSLQGLVNSVKGGGFLDILSSIFDVVLQLGSVGVFGKTFAKNLNRTMPAYAGGTNFHPGGLAMVGERGPEVVDLPRGSKVYPNGTGPGGSGGRIEIVDTTGLFKLRVEGIAGKVVSAAAPVIMEGSKNATMAQMGRMRTRTIGG